MRSINHGKSAASWWNFNPLNVQTRKLCQPYYIGWVLLCIIIYALPSAAQPSGGPYGPIKQKYEIPKDAGKIYYVAPDGQAKESGETPAKPTTLEAAIERAVTGDVIVMRGGVYRTGELQLNQGITIQPYADEEPILKGTFVADQWEQLRNGLWKTSWSRLFPSKPADWWWREYHGKVTPLHRFNNDMVFVDGKFLQSTGWEGAVDENSYFIDYDNESIFISINPTDRLVEITAFNGALRCITGKCHGKTSDGKGLVIRGITFTQYAYCAIEIEGTDPEGLSDESRHGKEIVGSTLENCTISFCSRVAAYLRGDRLTLRHCRVSDTSTEGIYILSSSDVLLEKNIFSRNNIEQISGYFPAAVKIFNQCYRVTCRDNLVYDLPYSNGIWYDVGNVDGYFINNWVEGVGNMNREFSDTRFWPSDNGFFFEISKGAVCAGNLFVNCDQGIYVINGSDVKIYNNTLVNSTVSIVRTARTAEGDHFGWHPSTGPDVDKREGHILVNNLFTADKNYNRPLLAFWQQTSLCERLQKPQVRQLDYNVYIQSKGNKSKHLILWSPAQNPDCQVKFASLEELRKMYPQFSKNSLYISDYSGPLFKSIELGNYQLLKTFPECEAAAAIPSDISKLLGISEENNSYIGAYPPLP